MPQDGLQSGGQMRRQLAQQQRQQQQQQQHKAEFEPPRGRELPPKQNQTRHNPVSENWQRGSAPRSDQ